jgi:hypothetical protein
VSEKQQLLSISQAFELAKEKVGVRSITTIRNWCRLEPSLVGAEYNRLSLIDPIRFATFMVSRRKQGQKWKPPPDPRPRRKRVGEGGHVAD